MPANAAKLTSIVEEYFSTLRLTQSTGAATPELSTYPALYKLLSDIGATLRPKVFCLNQPANQGAGLGEYLCRASEAGLAGIGHPG